MENLARRFDAPIDSPEHEQLAETAWQGGSLVSVRFYLGRLLGRNLFRESNPEVDRRLVEYFSRLTSPAGGGLLRDVQGWDVAGQILRFRFEMETKGVSAVNARNVAAVEAFLANPLLTLSELATGLGTTEKQLARNSSLTVLRKLTGHLPPADRNH